jgi:hypothetical protein
LPKQDIHDGLKYAQVAENFDVLREAAPRLDDHLPGNTSLITFSRCSLWVRTSPPAGRNQACRAQWARQAALSPLAPGITTAIFIAGIMLCSPLIAAESTMVGDSIASSSIPAGTTITSDNWQLYKPFMPDGMIALFEGKYLVVLWQWTGYGRADFYLRVGRHLPGRRH